MRDHLTNQIKFGPDGALYFSQPSMNAMGAPDTAWGEGAFVGAIEQALLDGRVDVAVHSAKDVPIDGDARLRSVAYLARADPRDVLVVREGNPARRLAALARGSTIGTDSPRRTGFLRARRPDLCVQPLHGNVDTRLRRLDEGAVETGRLARFGSRVRQGFRAAVTAGPRGTRARPTASSLAFSFASFSPLDLHGRNALLLIIPRRITYLQPGPPPSRRLRPSRLRFLWKKEFSIFGNSFHK